MKKKLYWESKEITFKEVNVKEDVNYYILLSIWKLGHNVSRKGPRAENKP